MLGAIADQLGERLVEPLSLLSQFPLAHSSASDPIPVTGSFDDWLFRDDPFFYPELLHDPR